jgi:hypothetical protein
MKLFSMRRAGAVSALVAAGLSNSASAVTITVDTNAAGWLGFMNVFELPSNGGGFVFPSGWGPADLTATFGSVITLSPNTIGDPDPFWYIGGGAPGNPGNKIMEANLYKQETDTLSGMSVTFSGFVNSNSFTGAHTAVAFIKDFAPDFSSNITTTVPLLPGAFNVTAITTAGAGRHVQYGFQVTGPNVWFTDTAPFGSAVVSAIPEPSTYAAIAGVLALALAARRARKS